MLDTRAPKGLISISTLWGPDMYYTDTWTVWEGGIPKQDCPNVVTVSVGVCCGFLVVDPTILRIEELHSSLQVVATLPFGNAALL